MIEPCSGSRSPYTSTATLTASCAVQALTGNSATNGTVGNALPMGSVAFTNSTLSLTGMDMPLDCPTGFRLSWGADTATTSTSTAG